MHTYVLNNVECIGTSKELASRVSKSLTSPLCSVVVKSMEEYDIEAYLHKEKYLIVLLSTWTDGKPPVRCEAFFEGLRDILHDFRYSKGTT